MMPPHTGLFLLCFGLIISASVYGADPCDTRAAQQKVAWGKSSHSSIASEFHKQQVELEQTWCHIWLAQGWDRLHNAEDFGRVLVTGEGLHPTAGNIVPGSGFAGGLTTNFSRAFQTKPVRLEASVEARGSTTSFWESGGKLDVWGTRDSRDDRHTHAVFTARHYGLPQLNYFGLGNSSAVANQTLYGLDMTLTRAAVEIPVPAGFSITGESEGLWSDPRGFHGSQTIPSIDRVFTPTNTPALNSSTAYFVSGGGIRWIYPVAERLNGYSTEFTSSFRLFHEASGEPFSFRRFDIVWIQRYTPAARFDLGRISAISRLVESWAPTGNSVPFYLQPTIGGTDIDNYDVLRSYRDYRFRAPNVLTFQAEYERAIRDPLGLLLFYDVGKAALTRGELDISHMRHSFGAGFTVRAGGLPVFKFYYAWGGSEGTHTAYTGNTNNFARGTLAGVF